MPIDVQTEASEASEAPIEVSAEHRHETAKAMIDSLMSKGMTLGEIEAYAIAHLEADEGGGPDPTTLYDVLRETSADKVAPGVDDKARGSAEEQFVADDDWVEKGIADAEKYANAGHESDEQDPGSEHTAASVKIPVTSVDEYDDDPILARTANPSGKSEQEQPNVTSWSAESTDDRIDRTIGDIHDELADIGRQLEDPSIDDNTKQALDSRRSELQQHLDFMLKRKDNVTEMASDAGAQPVDVDGGFGNETDDTTDEYEESPILARTNNPAGTPPPVPTARDIDIHAAEDEDAEPGADTPELDTEGDGGNDGDGEPPVELNLSYGRANVERDAKNLAHLYAEKKLSDELEEGGFVRKTLKRMFKGNILRQHYHTRYKMEYDRLVQEAQGEIYAPIIALYGEQGIGPEEAIQASRIALAATLERVMDDEFNMLREGESEQEISGDEAVDNQVRAVLRDLTLRFARGELDEQSLLTERNRMFGEIEGLNDELFGRGIRFTDNILELAINVRAALEHEGGMARVEEALATMELGGAIARSGANTELKQTIFDRFSDKVHTSRIGGTAIASSILLAGSVISSVTTKGSQRAASSALRLTGIGAGAAGVIAAANEYSAFRREAAYHRQESAYGIEHERGRNPRRDAMEALVYDMQDAAASTESMRTYLDEDGGLRADLSDQEILDAFRESNSMRAIMAHADEGGIDLLRFSSPEAAPRERLQLMRTRIELDRALEQRRLQGGELTLTAPDGTQNQFAVEEVFGTVRSALNADIQTHVEANVSTVNDAYQALMAKRMAKAFVAGTVAGFTVGALVQEGVALVNPNVAGVFEYQEAGKTNTLLNSLIFGEHNTGSSNPQVAEILQSAKGTDIITHKGTALRLEVPEGFEAKFNGGSNTFDLVSAKDGTVVADNLAYAKNGEISQQAIDELHKIGLNINQNPVTVNGAPKVVGADKFIDVYEKRGDLETTRLIDNAINRDPGLAGDRNELDLHAGGADGHWKTDSGAVRIKIAGLEDTGSWHGNKTYDIPQALQEGRGKVMLTVNDEYRPNGKYKTFLFDVERAKNGDWRAVIPKDHPAAKWFGDGGSISDFHGPSLEQLQNPNVDYLDSRNSLAFVIEEGTTAKGVHEMVSVASIPGTGDGPYEIPTPNVEYVSVMTGEALPAGGTLPVVGPPLYPRRGIGAPIRRNAPPTPPNPYYPRRRYGEAGYDGTGQSREVVESIRAEVSPAMLAGEQLDLAEQAEWYAARLADDFGPEYVEEVRRIIDSDPRISNLPDATRAIIAIPVGAAYEQDNIYNTLSLYARQQKVGEGEFSVALGVNNIEGITDDPQQRARVEKTLSEIERARRDFPQLNIIALRYEVPQEEVDRHGSIIGLVTRRLYDAVALAAGEHAASHGTSDILMVRNDADSRGISPVYVERLLKGADVMPNALAFTGESILDVTRLMPTHPGLALTLGFDAMLARLSPDRTGGANFAVKLGAYCGMRGLGSAQGGGTGSDDLAIGDRINAARGYASSTGSYGTSGYASGTTSSDSPIDRRPVRFVGASLESTGERQIRAYTAGRNPVHHAWDDFSSGDGGFTPRYDGLGRLRKENMGEAIRSAETYISEMMNDRGMSRAQAETHLLRYFGHADRYRLSARRDGTLALKITRPGERYIGQLRSGKQFKPGEGGIAGRNIRKKLNAATGTPRYIRAPKRRFGRNR